MQSKLLAILAGTAIAMATTQFAAAGERQHTRKHARPSATATEQFRNSNAAWTTPQASPGVYSYSGGFSAPAGH
jgi:hypothetical protein